MTSFLIDFYNSEITATRSSTDLNELIDIFEDKINSTFLGEVFRQAKKIYLYENRDREIELEENEEMEELMKEKTDILNRLFNPNYSDGDPEYIECNDGYIYYRNSVDHYGKLLGGISGHWLQILYNDYY
jgi:hypothetical protein